MAASLRFFQREIVASDFLLIVYSSKYAVNGDTMSIMKRTLIAVSDLMDILL